MPIKTRRRTGIDSPPDQPRPDDPFNEGTGERPHGVSPVVVALVCALFSLIAALSSGHQVAWAVLSAGFVVIAGGIWHWGRRNP